MPDIKTSDFDYVLPVGLIAQTPIEPRDQSRLMVLNQRGGTISHDRFANITDYLVAGDVLVFNDSRVIPARLNGIKEATGGRVEILLLRRRAPNIWEVLVKPGKRVKTGARVLIASDSVDSSQVVAEVIDTGEDGVRVLSFTDETQLPALGKIALPPYIHSPLTNPERYQTVYARDPGSVAAPTAGLHFTPALLEKLTGKGVRCLFVTLHIGLDTFRPVKEDDPRQHNISREYGVLDSEVAGQLSQAKSEGRRIICVGTTAVRLVEAAAQASPARDIQPFAGWVDLFILPGYRFRMVDALITNFHLPRSTLLMLVSAFAGREFILRAYQEAIDQRYRFYSFGDAMLIF